LTAIGEQWKKRDVRFQTGFNVKVRATPDNRAEIFTEYIRTIFLLSLRDSRNLDQCTDENAFVFMDDWIGHVGEEIMDFLREARVVLTT
jgi:hypothetical protein